MSYTEAGGLLKVELASQTLPNFTIQKSKDWVYFGDANNYPDYIIELFNRNAYNSSIITGKASYIFGKGLQCDEANTVLELAKIQQALEVANPFESWNDLINKTIITHELFDGWAWQIVWSQGSVKITEVYNMEFSKLRRSKCGKKVYYCDCWVDASGKPNPNPEKDPSFKCYDAFNPAIRTGTQILYKVNYKPSSQKFGHLYPIPNYIGCIADIETDIEITNFHFYNLKNGMFASALLSLFNGDPSPEEKKKIAKMFNYSHSGTLNTGKVIFSFNDKGGTAPSLQPLTPSDLDKQFELLAKRLQQNIFTGHKVDPVLFGIMVEGQLGDTSAVSIVAKWEKFINSYVELRQEIILNEIKGIFAINGMDASELEFIQMQPVGLELPSDPNIHKLFDAETLKKYYAKRYGIEIAEEDSTDTITDNEELRINEHLKKLSGRDWQHIKRMVREVKNGKTDKTVAGMMLKNAYGLSDADLQVLFNTTDAKFNNQDRTDELIALFEKFAIDDNDTDEFISSEAVHFHSDKDAELNELRFYKNHISKHYMFLSDKEKAILDMIKGQPSINADEIAKQLNLDVVDVAEIIAGLIAANYLLNLGNTFEPTSKAIAKELPPVETEVYTVYKYELRPDVPRTNDGKRIQSRPFCERMVALSNSGKRWTRDAIDSISNEFGDNAWTYRGGFYTNGNTGDTTPYCRHQWVSIRKVRKKS